MKTKGGGRNENFSFRCVPLQSEVLIDMDID